LFRSNGDLWFGISEAFISNQPKVIVANPLQTHAFTKIEMARNKTDKADAMSIARYCQYLFNRGEIDKILFIPRSAAFERVRVRVLAFGVLKSEKPFDVNYQH
jgi:transposase